MLKVLIKMIIALIMIIISLILMIFYSEYPYSMIIMFIAIGIICNAIKNMFIIISKGEEY